ncbi:hypothetical protein IEN85_08190 [Pelagicoccus sp. NFK12]|uniref:Uncharacterized protein n=1 Tax=Pelagicoccus enzymogenes TaxID=2773457 RepID=A0A927F845_9BACT|nr:hypothetical protein [Pelagicoccus enzymogenes]MBD5779471.1 hypothetical protein [Pelagicoccus enzymogenes]
MKTIGIAAITGVLCFLLAHFIQTVSHEKNWIAFTADDGHGHGPDPDTKEWEHVIERKIERNTWIISSLATAGIVATLGLKPKSPTMRKE